MDVLNKLVEIVSDYKGEKFDNITKETTFDALGFDSLDKVDLMMEVEDKFSVTLGDDMTVVTVGDLVDKIEQLQK